MAFGCFLLGSHKFMVMALGSWLMCEVALMGFVSQYLSIGCWGVVKHTLYRLLLLCSIVIVIVIVIVIYFF